MNHHVEPQRRTPVTKGWWDRMKEERIRWALWWFRWRFRRNGRGNLNSGKEKMKILETRIYSSRTNSEEKGLLDDDEIRIRFIVCLSFIKLNWWQAMDFAYYLFFLKRIKGGIAQNLRKSSWTTGRIWRERMNLYDHSRKNLERATVGIETNDEKRMNHRKE